MRSGRSSWMLICAAVSVCAGCTYLLGLEDVQLATDSTGGAGGSAGATSNGGGGQGGTTTTGGGAGSGGSGGCPATVCAIELAEGQNTPAGITVANDVAYWVNKNSGEVMQVNLVTLEQATLAFSVLKPEKVVADGTNVYVMHDDAMNSRRIWSENDTMDLADANSVIDLATGAGSLFWLEGAPDDNVSKLGVATDLVSGVSNALSIAVDNDGVYWSTSANISSATTDGMNVLSPQSAIVGALKVVVGGAYIYWITSGTGLIQRIEKANIETGAPADVVQGSADVSEFVVAGDTVYWGESTGLKKVVIGGQPSSAHDGARPTSIFADSSRVVWTDSGGSVWMLAR